MSTTTRPLSARPSLLSRKSTKTNPLNYAPAPVPNRRQRKPRTLHRSPDEVAELLSIGAEFFSQDAIREMTSPSSEAGSERSDSAQSDASTVFRSNTSSPPGRISANYPAGGLSKPRPTRASLMRETSGKTYAAAAEAAIVAEAAKDLRQLPKPIYSPKAAATEEVAPAAVQAPPPPAEPEQEFELVKVGVPWRGDYPRLMVVGNDRVSTLDPTTRRETNGWSASGVVRVEAVREANRVLIHLGVGVAPWQRVTLATADVETADAVLASLEAMAVPVSRAALQ